MTPPKNRPGRSRWLVRRDVSATTEFVVEFERGRVVHCNRGDLLDLKADLESVLDVPAQGGRDA